MSQFIPIDEYALGERIRFFRKSRRLTQAVLSKRCKITQGALAQIEKSYVLPSLHTLQDISRELDVEMAVFFAREEVAALNVKKLKQKYKKLSDLTPSLERQLRQVVTYAKSLGIV